MLYTFSLPSPPFFSLNDNQRTIDYSLNIIRLYNYSSLKMEKQKSHQFLPHRKAAQTIDDLVFVLSITSSP